MNNKIISVLTNMKVCIVIPALIIDEKLFNITMRFLDSIDKKTSYQNYEVLIYDNNSDPKLTERLTQEINNLKNKNKFRAIKLGNYQFNLSRVYNMSLKDSDAELFIFANNDMEIINGEWLTNIVKWFEITPIMGICIPVHDFLGNPFNISPSEVLKDHGEISFAVFCITRKVIKEIGGFDERFDLYFHDHYVFKTVIKKNYKVLWAHNALIKHHGQRTTIDHLNVKRHNFEGAYSLLKSID